MEKFHLSGNLYLLIGCGGALGSILRALVSDLSGWLLGTRYPWGTLLVNVLGSLAIGWLAFLRDSHGNFVLQAPGRAFLLVGVLGGFTTFSTFSLQTLELLLTQKWASASVYIVVSITSCLFAAWLGVMMSYKG